MIHRFPEEFTFEEPCAFTDPFRYTPHPAVVEAARLVIRDIESDPALSEAFAEGKMLGVLVCRGGCYLAAFSGNAGGRSHIPGFVPPIFDLLDPSGHFKISEAEISEINGQIARLEKSEEILMLKTALTAAEKEMKEETDRMKAMMAEARIKRESIRSGCFDQNILSALIKESQFEKAELKRLKASWEKKISSIRSCLGKMENEILSLKGKRVSMSESLQDWIFRQYIVHNASGESTSISDLFSNCGLVPPGGTGECAAPKLLEYAYRNDLQPLAMGEFWYGRSPQTAVRTHGHFYPSCTSKCGPLLGYMMKGLECIETSVGLSVKPLIIYQDRDIIVTEKPSGMPSVPGLDGRESLQEWLGDCIPVHRLDMDTSGVIIFARNEQAAVNLRRQFEDHSIRKTYMARVSANSPVTLHSKGTVDLPLSADYDERPRQKVDFQQGKPSHTVYEVVNENPDGTTDLLLYPHTGRTHQLRVHCAHTLGLGRPIVGDRLYGSASINKYADTRLHLHALRLTFRHPITDEVLTFSSETLSY